jgi:hypothetical protein
LSSRVQDLVYSTAANIGFMPAWSIWIIVYLRETAGIKP